ncbi:MAG: ROK family protein [Candidatus Micrarchaeota archaeon]|nr:ROK family protein [Candidatus Micrarchaeota archaeon]MDE1847875.1 ROK family protein [Candidatus Micrarchaeota archaeon]MDE1864202.1 ROK family protein [Candidatus Micrarchaeota archaeon]
MKFIGIDIGATNLRTAVVDQRGRLSEGEYQKSSAKRMLDQIFEMVDGYSRLGGIGIGSIGPLDSNAGVITTAINLDLGRLEIVRHLEKRYGVPCKLLNDCVAGVYGEKKFGAGKKVRNLVYLTLSTGIGCGVIADGNLVFGKDGNAHEIGHCSVDTELVLRCGCGSMGRHWEAYCGGINIPKFARRLIKEYKESGESLDRIEEIGARHLFENAGSDPLAKRIVNEIGRINASGIGAIINAYDPELITIGGSIALKNRELVLGPIKKYVGSYVVNAMPKIAITPLGEDVVLIGAAAYITDMVRRG